MSGTAPAALEVAGVHVALRGKPVLRDLCLSLADGECRAIVGLNGAGKTTALRVILGMLRPDAGRVLLHGRDIASSPGMSGGGWAIWWRGPSPTPSSRLGRTSRRPSGSTAPILSAPSGQCNG